MKKSAAVRKVAIPSLSERFAAIVEELFDAPVEERLEALRMLDQELDHALDMLAEERRPKGPHGIPVGYIRQQMDQRGRGNSECYIAAVAAAMKEGR